MVTTRPSATPSLSTPDRRGGNPGGRWPVFNVADIALTAGIVIIGMIVAKHMRRTRGAAKDR
jgi:lipoprotein signal peptidase